MTAFAAFVAYRDLGPDRSGAKAAKALGKSTRTLDRWTSRHRWVERALAWDEHLDDKACEAAESEVEERTRRHLEYCRKMQAIGMARLEAIDEDDPTDDVETDEARRLLDTAIKLERLIAGEADSRTDHILVDSALEQMAKVLAAEVTDPETRKRLLERFSRIADVTDDNGGG